jgi:hypothetical protein
MLRPIYYHIIYVYLILFCQKYQSKASPARFCDDVAVPYPCHECFILLRFCRHTCLCINTSNLLAHRRPCLVAAKLCYHIVIMAKISWTHGFTDAATQPMFWNHFCTIPHITSSLITTHISRSAGVFEEFVVHVTSYTISFLSIFATFSLYSHVSNHCHMLKNSSALSSALTAWLHPSTDVILVGGLLRDWGELNGPTQEMVPVS